jgi:hypothetical protein
MFRSIAYAKLNLSFNREEFIEEYDRVIYPGGFPITNADPSRTAGLNKVWGMVPPEIYEDVDYFDQPGDYTTCVNFKGSHRMWTMRQLMTMDTTGITDPYLIKMAPLGGPGLRNLTLSTDYKFFVKPEYKDLKIVKWIQSLPIEDIHSLHCVALEAGDFATIHRDQKSMSAEKETARSGRVFNSGFITISLSISNGGAPLWYALDGKDIIKPHVVDDDIFITNDYFVHGVGVCTERRRQIRITARPKPELFDLIDKSTLHDIGPNYVYDPRLANYLGED